MSNNAVVSTMSAEELMETEGFFTQVVMTNAEKRDVLLRAKRLLEDVGWCTSFWAKKNEAGEVIAYCGSGAIYAATCKLAWEDKGPLNYEDKNRLTEMYNDVRIELRKLFQDELGPYQSLPSFNDKHTKEEVLALFDTVIERLAA